MDQRELPEILIEMNCHMLFLIGILKRSICLFLRKQMDAEFFQNYKWKMNLPKGFKKSVSPWTSTNNHSLRRQSSARIQKYFCPVAKRHDFFYQTVIDDCSSRFLKQGPNSFKGLIIGWLTLQSRNFQLQASTPDFSTPDQSYIGIPTPKYSEHYLLTVARTIDCVSSEILNHGLNHGLLFSLFKVFGWKNIPN